MKLGDFIAPTDDRNVDNRLGVESVRGISTDKHFIATKANLEGVSLSSYKLVKPRDFAFVSDTSRRGDKMSLAYNSS
ncbi:MAG: restriction endonuclease subunit S, partial [Akkermansia sp.]